MLGISSGIEEFGFPLWQLVMCLLSVYIIVIICLSKGIQSSGKARISLKPVHSGACMCVYMYSTCIITSPFVLQVSYVTSLFPYVILVILFFRGLSLEGWQDGVYYYLVPDWQKLLSPKVL